MTMLFGIFGILVLAYDTITSGYIPWKIIVGSILVYLFIASVVKDVINEMVEEGKLVSQIEVGEDDIEELQEQVDKLKDLVMTLDKSKSKNKTKDTKTA